jgi:nucleotide sugar dehydrogenase
MSVTLIGAGKLGLAYAGFISSKGFKVHCIDKNSSIVNDYSNGVFETQEPCTKELVERFPMTYSTDITTASGDFIIILVNTPTCLAGYDHSILESVLESVKTHPRVIITSTVQPGFCDRQNIPGLVYNPLFVQIGNVIDNLDNVTDVLIGGSIDDSVTEFYHTIFGDGVTLHTMSYRGAEVAKLALNSFITTKISFANMIGDSLRTCGHSDGDIDSVLNFIGSDSRIGNKCLKYGWGYGGPCFPRDNRALATYLREVGSYDYLPIASHESNERHAVEQAKHFTGSSMENVCYKDNCNVPVIEESHKIKTALILKSMGKKVQIVDTPEILGILPRELL